MWNDSDNVVHMKGKDTEYLITNKFTKFPLEQQLKIKQGRPTPKLDIKRSLLDS